MAVGPDGLDWDFIRAYAALPPEEKAKVDAYAASQNQPGQRFVPTVQDGQIVTPTVGTPRTDNPLYSPPSQVAKPDTSSSNESAAASASLLRQYGLEELIPIVDGWIRSGMTWAEVENQLYDRGSAAGKVVDRIYPELRMRQENNLEPMSIAQIQEYRTNARQLLRAAGLPEGFYDQNSDFTDWIAKDVGLPELNDRVQGYKALASQAPAETLAAMKRLYGVGPEGLAAYWIDPTRALPILEKQAAAASTSGAAARSGFGDLTAAEAERLASVGVQGASAVDAFGQLAQAGELFNPLPGENATGISRQQQLDYLAGDSATAAAISKKAKTRAAETAGGGGFVTSNTGYSGFGSAR